MSEDEPRNGTLGGGEERQTTVQLEAQNRLKKLNDMMTRATQIINMKSTLIDRTSNINKDFDYLFLRRVDNTRFFKQVQTILNQYYEDNQIAVFSEIVQQYNAKMAVTEMIIMITSHSIYMLD